MRKSLLPILGLALLVAGCLASTDVESMVRPDWERSPFERLVVYYSSSDLEARKQVEGRFAAKDSAFVAGHELFFPGESYSAEEVTEIMEENELEAALLILPKGAGSSTSIIPGQTRTSCVGNTCTSTGGPIAVSRPHADFGALVLEWDSKQRVWAASADAGGNAFADQGNLRESLVDAVIERLREDGLLEPETGE